MAKLPLILIAPTVDGEGSEFGDLSVGLSMAYPQAVEEAGGLPMLLPPSTAAGTLSDCVRRSDGVLLTGGEDVEPGLHTRRLAQRLRQTVSPSPDGVRRDLRELLVIDQVFRQHKPLMAICRGQQILNVALGGSLLVDIPAQVPQALNHRRNDRCREVAHKVRLTPGSLLARITGMTSLGVNSTHHQAVARVAAPLRVAAVSEDGVIEGLELRPDAARCLPFLLSVQFHPERLADRYPEHRALFGAFVRACQLNGQERL